MNPFRELFVEVAQGLLEAAAIEAQQRKAAQPAVHHRPSIATALDEDYIARLLCEHFGWLSASTWRAAADRRTDFGVKMRCGHRHVFGIADSVLEDAHRGQLLSVIEDAWRGALGIRKCYCVDPGRVV